MQMRSAFWSATIESALKETVPEGSKMEVERPASSGMVIESGRATWFAAAARLPPGTGMTSAGFVMASIVARGFARWVPEAIDAVRPRR